jgi:hypothetical protein
LWAFFQQLLFVDNFIEFRVSLCFWGEFPVFFLANYLLISLQIIRYSVRRQIYYLYVKKGRKKKKDFFNPDMIITA